jgi:ceramide glucosyltransferase
MSYLQLPYVHWSIAVLGLACLGTAACYSVLTLTAVLVWRLRRPTLHPRIMPPVTLLKPLCGAEHGLYDRLRSFCQQDYRQFQIVFGVRDPDDPALIVVQRLQQEFPALPIEVVASPPLHGSNYKISNLINMVAQARHDVLIIADSDTFVGPDYLRSVTAPLLDRSVGLVTCPYRDVPTARIWSRLGAMYINEWYMPSVLFAWLFGGGCYASGQTLCLRRQTLEAVGGFQAVTNHLADDHRLGELIRSTGLKIVLSPTAVQAVHDEPDLDALTRHELRWMRTIHKLRPWSFRLIFLTFSLPMAIAGFALSAAAAEPMFTLTARWLLAIVLAARLGVHFAHRIQSNQAADRSALADLWLVPVRDALLGWYWFVSFLSSRISWRGGEFNVDADGIMH